jgi:Skp family chaperone for outer membrane proteins
MVLNSQDDTILIYVLKLLYKSFCCCFITKDNAANFHYEKAPEPSDVYWENMNVTFVQRFKVVSVTYLLTAMVIGVCFAVTLGLSVLKDQMNDDLEDREAKGEKISTVNWAGVRFVTTISSLFVVIVNKFLLIVVRKFSLKERHLTLTGYNLSVATKLTLARFFNSAMVPIFVNWEIENWFDQGGLVQDVSYLILIIAFTEPLTMLIDVFYIKRLFMRYKNKGSGEDCRMTQAEANDLMCGNKLDMANRMANTANLFLLTLFYTPIVPWAPIAGLIGMFFSYMVDKYLLLRRHQRPEEMSGFMIHFFSNIVPYFILFWSISNFVFIKNVVEQYNETYEDEANNSYNIAIAGMAIVGIYIAFPVRTIINKCFDDNKEDEFSPYKDNYMNFLTDYDRENPVTKKKGMMRLIDSKKQAMDEQFQKDLDDCKDEEEKKKKQEEQAQIKKKIEEEQKKVQNATFFDASKNYTQKRAVNNQIANGYTNQLQTGVQRGGYYNGYGYNYAAQSQPVVQTRAYAGSNPQMQAYNTRTMASQQALQGVRAQNAYANPYAATVTAQPVAPPRQVVQPVTTYAQPT